jgi:hypothetical protein
MMVTTALLTDARVAIYPVDARGLVGASVMDASKPGTDPETGYLRLGPEFAKELERTNQRLVGTHQGMEAMADFTGGRVFKNRNDIDNAIATGIREGSTYYVLGYYAENKNWDGKFQELRVRLKRPGLTVRHRKGYFAFDPQKWETRSKAVQADMAWTLEASGMPATQVVFDVRIEPALSGQLVKLPMEFRVDLKTLSAQPLANAGRKYQVEFHAIAVNAKGEVAARRDQGLTAPIQSADLEALERQGLPFRMELELLPGQYELRLGVRDIATGAFGTLSAPVDLPAPANEPSTPLQP